MLGNYVQIECVIRWKKLDCEMGYGVQCLEKVFTFWESFITVIIAISITCSDSVWVCSSLYRCTSALFKVSNDLTLAFYVINNNLLISPEMFLVLHTYYWGWILFIGTIYLPTSVCVVFHITVSAPHALSVLWRVCNPLGRELGWWINSVTHLLHSLHSKRCRRGEQLLLSLISDISQHILQLHYISI